MSNDLPSVKASLGPISTDVVEWWKWFKKRKKPNRVSLAAERFLQLFENHGVAATRIQHFIPQLTFDKVQKPEALLSSPTPAILDQAAQLFKVRRAWLEGVDDLIYEQPHCYKSPEFFFEELAAIPRQHGYAIVRGLRCTETLDYRDPRSQPITLVMMERIFDFEDTEVFRYRVFGDGWDWNYPPSRIQLKAMVRIMEDLDYHPTPLDPAPEEIVERVREGRLIPRPYLRRPYSTTPSLDDYVCIPEEHAHAKECDELPYVREYIANENLEKIAREKLFATPKLPDESGSA